MQEYKESVKNLAKNSEDFTFPNKGKEHAQVVVGEIFQNVNSIKMFSGKLDYEILKDLFDTIKDFINDEDKSFFLILDEQNIKGNEIIHFLCENNIKIKIANDNFRDEVKQISKNNNIYHFIIGDDKTFRIEVDTDEYKAICNFNNKEISSRFSKIYDEYFNKLEDFKGC